MKPAWILACLFFSAPALPADTLRAALDRAWERAVAARSAESRQLEAEAGRAVGESWLAEAPLLGASQRSDRYHDNRGARETELELALPLWLPGQKTARLALADRQIDESEAGLAATRLQLAGELREAVWALARAEAQLAQAGAGLAVAEQLAADVARREAAGDLARTDLLLAQEEVLQARGVLAGAQRAVRQAGENYRYLTGLDGLPVRHEEKPADASPADHPLRRLAEAERAKARAEMDFVAAGRRDAPELSIGWRQSREVFGGAARDSLAVGIRIPFATESRNAPRLAAANGALIRAEAEARRILAGIERDERYAAGALEQAEQAEAAACARVVASGERLRLLDKAFRLGELPLAERLRAEAAARQANLAAALGRIERLAAIARLNQARGVLP